jgi:ABC-type sugar transport systems, permease components
MKKKFGYRVNILLFLLPALFLFISVLIAPIVMSAYYSLFKWKGVGPMTFIGFQNYSDIFTMKTVNAGRTLKNALLLAAFSTVIQLPFALWLALKLAKGIKGERGFLSIYFMPVLISTVVIGQLWIKIYDGDNGLVNVALRAVGLLGEKDMIVWLGDKNIALWAAFVPILWQYVGYHMLLMYAGIKSVPPELSEAAMLDGCTEGQLNRYIIIPYIKPILKVSVIFAVTGSLKSYDLIKVLTNGGPASTTEVPSILMYRQLFLANSYGRGSAIAVLLIALCFAFALLINLALRG